MKNSTFFPSLTGISLPSNKGKKSFCTPSSLAFDDELIVFYYFYLCYEKY